MTKVQKTVNIKAPAEKIFSYISNPKNLPEVWPSLVGVSDVKPLPNGGHSSRWLYKMAGMSFEGTSEDTKRVPNKRLVYKTEGGVKSTQTWTLQPKAGGTKVTVTVGYTVPIPILGKLAEAIIVKMNDLEADLVMANLKTRMEA